MNIAIVDDLSYENDKLKNILNEYAAINKFALKTDEYNDGESFLNNYSPYAYTIVFLDIFMDGLSGVDIAKMIRKSDPDTIIVFLTTSVEHMADAFSIHAYDYITKPTCTEKLFRVMDDILHNHTTFFSDTFSFTTDGQSYALAYPDIVSVITAEHNYLDIIDKTGNVYHPRMTFSYALKELETDKRFLQINRNIIVNLDNVEALNDGMCLLSNHSSFPVYSKKTKEIERKWHNYTFSKIRKNNKERGFHL